jgi:hypothetical protein
MIKIFLSHSGSDVDLAVLLIEFIRLSLDLKSDEIRCSSVDGYRLSAGVNIDEQLRHEIFESTVLIGLISQDSLQSTYVLFELGARWGAQKPIIPLLVSDLKIDKLAPPLSGLNALRCDSRANLHQLIHDLTKYLDIPMNNPAAYERYIQKIIDVSVKPLTILRPRNGDAVPHRPIVEGMIRDLESEVWLIVHPLGNPGYWVQPKVETRSDGTWRAQIFIGRSGIEDIGAYYEVCAVANPKANLKEGDILDTWPQADYRTDVIELLRV